jgi:hypothetical protein
MKQPSNQTELRLTGETVNSAIPEDGLGQGPQLLGQRLREAPLTEKEEPDEP